MAVVDHLKTASAEMMKAAELVKQEIEALRKDHTMLKTQREVQIAGRLDNIRSIEHDIRAADDPNKVSQLQVQLQAVNRQVADLRHDISEHQREVENAVSQKLNMVNSLESQARSIGP